jgi:2-octaprenyl-6-methoxyphenol hydroxylase
LQPATPIEGIHISQRGGFGRVQLDAAEARLLVVAEGGSLAAATARTRDYKQSVVTARVTSARPHGHVAYERFTPEGPLALLPTGNQFALVWTTTTVRAQQLCAMSDNAFLGELQQAVGGRVGTVLAAGARSSYPLALKVAAPGTDPRVVAIGNAAQTLHPVAGQGLNIGLRDAWELAETVRACGRDEVGTEAHLRAFALRRRVDRSGGIHFTDALVRLFSNDAAPLRFARGLGLAALGVMPPVKDFVVRRMTFGARG